MEKESEIEIKLLKKEIALFYDDVRRYGIEYAKNKWVEILWNRIDNAIWEITNERKI